MSTNTRATIRKIARIHDQANEKYLEVIEFPRSQSKTGRVELLPSVVSDLSAFEKNLRDAGAVLPKEEGEIETLLDAVAKSNPPTEWVYAERTGWTDDRKAFVLADTVVGETSNKIVGVNRAASATEPSGRLSTSGTWEGWRDSVGQLARHSTVLMFSTAVALGAPLLAITNRRSFTINLCGRSGSGKTVATLVAGSIIGIARDADLITWNIKDARLEQRLAEFNDSVFPIDDLMAMGGRDRDRYQRIRDLAYRIAQGWATGRHDSYTAGKDGGVHRGWRSIVLTSSETAIRNLAHAVKLERQHGEARRLIDVPALADGQRHIFDRLPSDLDKSDVDAWKKASFANLANACEQNHGQAWRMYIKSLIDIHADLKVYVEKRISYFERRACDDFDGEVARDVARNFGVIYAGGMLGIKCGLLLWEKSELLNAIRTIYRRARDLLPDDGILLRSGMEALTAKLHQLPSVSSGEATKAALDYDNLDGYKQPEPNTNRYVIKREAYRQIFSSAEQETLVTRRLIEKQRITLSTPKGSEGVGEPTPKGQFNWPDGERRRSIEIVRPLKKPRAPQRGESKDNKKKKKPQAKKGK